MPSMEVTGLSEAAIAENFSFAEVSLRTQGGESLRCRFQPKVLDMIIAQLAQVMTHIRNNTVSAEVYATPPIALVSDAMAAAPAEGTHVVLTLTGANGVVFHFAFEPDIATRLRSEIEIAENSVREQTRLTRQ
jgi:hypothetical protein